MNGSSRSMRWYFSIQSAFYAEPSYPPHAQASVLKPFLRRSRSAKQKYGMSVLEILLVNLLLNSLDQVEEKIIKNAFNSLDQVKKINVGQIGCIILADQKV